MFDRFTDRARKVMGYARQASDRLKHDHIGTEHILLGLVEEGSGVAANVLEKLQVRINELRGEVEGAMEQGPDTGAELQKPFTRRARRVLDHAMDEARELGHNYVGTEHLLLGLLRERECRAAELLCGLGVEPDDVRREVRALIGDQPVLEEFTVPSSGKPSLAEMMPHVDEWHAQAEVAGDSLLAARLRYLLDYLRERTQKEGGPSDSPG